MWQDCLTTQSKRYVAFDNLLLLRRHTCTQVTHQIIQFQFLVFVYTLYIYVLLPYPR